MNRSPLKPTLTLLLATTVTLLLASSHSIAQDATCTLSGHVVDVKGTPIAGLPIAVQPIEISNGDLWPTYILDDLEELDRMLAAYAALPKSQTDATGRFSITGIKPGPIQLLAQPFELPDDGISQSDFDPDDSLAPDAEVLSIEIGKIAFYSYYQENPPPLGGITFAIEPGAHFKNVEVTVRPRMRIRGRIAFTDGTPLANAKVRIQVRQSDFDGMDTGSSGRELRTDDAGYFVEYVEEPGFYTVAIEFQGLSVTSKQFTLEAGQRHDDLVLTLDSEPVPIEPVPEPDSAGQWVLNPENGHSYMRIHCESWDDAQAKAVAEGAHLVAINDAAEQQWLVRAFGTAPYWIGLTDVAKESEWGWTSGEPVTYTNWALHRLINADRGEENYVFMGLSPDGRWHKVGPDSPEWRIPPMAILEKEVLPAKSSVEEK